MKTKAFSFKNLFFPSWWNAKKNKIHLDTTPPMQYTYPMNDEYTKLAFPANPIHLASTLTGKTIRYRNTKDKSSVTRDGVRVFKVDTVEDVFTSQNSGAKCVTVSVKDIDDSGSRKYRTLHVNGIESIA